MLRVAKFMLRFDSQTNTSLLSDFRGDPTNYESHPAAY